MIIILLLFAFDFVGPRPDLDPDIVAALDDALDLDDPENILEDDFFVKVVYIFISNSLTFRLFFQAIWRSFFCSTWSKPGDYFWLNALEETGQATSTILSYRISQYFMYVDLVLFVYLQSYYWVLVFSPVNNPMLFSGK